MPTESNGKSLAIMGFHERRLSHDVIELRNEQLKLHESIEALKIAVSQQKFGPRATPPIPLRGGPETAQRFHASPKMSPILKVPQVSVTENMTEVFASEINKAFEELSATFGDAIARLQLQLNSMHVDDTPKGSNLEVSGPTSGVPYREHDQLFDFEALRQEVRQIKEEHADKIDSLSQRLERVHCDVSLLALESGRIALRAGEMGQEDRNALLEMMELKEAAISRSGDVTLGQEDQKALLEILERREAAVSKSGNVTPRSMDSLASMNSSARSAATMIKFKHMLMELGNTDTLSGDATPATPATPALSVDLPALGRRLNAMTTI